jgi:hypothetical protein
MEHQQQPAAREIVDERMHVSLLIRKSKPRRLGQCGAMHASEEEHVHELARFDEIDVRGNLDVAVGKGHARDVA